MIEPDSAELLQSMPSKPAASLSKITFSGGHSFNLIPDEKIILVGPNNSGKSQSLREILAICQNGEKERTMVVSSVEVKKVGTITEFRDFLDREAVFSGGMYSYLDWHIHENQINFWTFSHLNHGLAGGFIKRIAADDRLRICEQQNSIAVGDHKSKPQHILYDDEGQMKKISDLFRRALARI